MQGRLFYGFEAEELFDAHPPIRDESLLSWVARNAIENELPNITTILRDVGQRHRNKMTDVMRGDVDVDGLATILGSDAHTVERMRGDDLGDGGMRYLGALVRHGDVHTAARRFSPAALRSDQTPFYRASWLLRTFPVCTETWEVLRSACDCGTEQNWATVHTMVLCDNCGVDLRDLESDGVPDSAKEGLNLLADILFGDMETRSKAMSRLPEPLRTLDGGDVFELALLMARVVDPKMGNPREKVWRDEPMRLAIALAKAGSLLQSWPATPWLALESVGDPIRMHPRSAPLRALRRVLSHRWNPGLPSRVKRLLDDIVVEITLDRDDGPHPLVDLNEAEVILRMNKKDIRAARAAGHLGRLFVIRHGEIIPGYERARLEAIAAVGNWPAASTTAKNLGIPPYGLEQLCAMDEMQWAKSPHRTVKAGLLIDPDSATEFEDRLRSSARSMDDLRDPVPLTTVMRGIGGCEKPWGPVVRALLEGEWFYALGRRGNILKEIFVKGEDVEAIRSISFDPSDWPLFDFSTALSQTDACDVLNVSIRRRSRIEHHKAGNRNCAWVFDRTTLGNLAARIVTVGELRARHRLENKTTQARIRRAGIEPLDFGYARAEADARFAT